MAPQSGPRVLIVTHELLRANLSGPAVRAIEMGRALAERQPVTVATPFPAEISDDRLEFATYSFGAPRTLRALVDASDVVIIQGFTLRRFGFLATTRVPLVVDLYCPFTIEHLELADGRPGLRERLGGTGTPSTADLSLLVETGGVLEVQNALLRRGDFFICASERQRDFWIGALHTAGRVNPWTYAQDPTLQDLIDVVPFGVPDARPLSPAGEPSSTVMKGQRAGIAPTDHVLLWGGSILDWQDPQTLIRAVASIAARRRDVKLFFMGTRHPNPEVPPMRALSESIELSRSLSLLDAFVFFNDWVPYEERWRYLVEADLGLSTHRQHLETHLSFRTRMLDYIWCGLPIVCTAGDVFGDLVASRGLGATVPPENPERLAMAIESLLDDRAEHERCRQRLLALADEYRWRRVVAPLARYCEAPRPAADRMPSQAPARRRLARRAFMMRSMRRLAYRLGLTRASVERLRLPGQSRPS